MADQKLLDEVGRYIDRYYEPAKDDIKIDKEMLGIFDQISSLRKKRAEERVQREDHVYWIVSLSFQKCGFCVMQ